MTYETKQDILNRVKEHYDSIDLPDYRKFGVVLMGSQNYKLHDKNSDIDTKAIILPSLEELALNKQPLSHLKIQSNDEHTDLKDVRLFINSYKKQNPNMLETLYTEYLYINPIYKEFWDNLVIKRDNIVRLDEKRAINAIIGMIYEKQKALCHPYPTLIDKINKYGYDGKQLSHAIRLEIMLKYYIDGESYAKGLMEFDNDTKQYLIDVKRNKLFDKERAIEEMDKVLNSALSYRELAQPNQLNEDVSDYLDNWLVSLLKFALKKELE